MITTLATATPDQMRQALAEIIEQHASGLINTPHAAEVRVCVTCSDLSLLCNCCAFTGDYVAAPCPTVRTVMNAGIEVPA